MKVILMMAMTVNGFVALRDDHFPDWTSKEDKKIFIESSKRAGVLIMGRKTYSTINKPLANRLIMVMTSQPNKFTSQLGIVEFTKDEPEMILQNLSARGYKEVIVAGGPSINSLFLKNNLIDELYITIEPKLFGSGLGLSSSINDLIVDLKLIELKKINDNSIFLKYQIIKN